MRPTPRFEGILKVSSGSRFGHQISRQEIHSKTFFGEETFADIEAFKNFYEKKINNGISPLTGKPIKRKNKPFAKVFQAFANKIFEPVAPNDLPLHSEAEEETTPKAATSDADVATFSAPVAETAPKTTETEVKENKDDGEGDDDDDEVSDEQDSIDLSKCKRLILGSDRSDDESDEETNQITNFLSDQDDEETHKPESHSALFRRQQETEEVEFLQR